MEESVVRIISATEAEVVLSDSRTNCCIDPVLFIDLVEPIHLLNHSICVFILFKNVWVEDRHINRDLLNLFR